MNADHYCAFMHSFAPNSRIRTRINVAQTLREMINDPVSIMRIACKDKIMGFRIKFFDKSLFLTTVLSMFIHKISLKHSRETTASNLFQTSLLRSVVAAEKCAPRKTGRTYYS